MSNRIRSRPDVLQEIRARAGQRSRADRSGVRAGPASGRGRRPAPGGGRHLASGAFLAQPAVSASAAASDRDLEAVHSSSSFSFDAHVVHGRIGPQAGSEPSSGVGIWRSLRAGKVDLPDARPAAAALAGAEELDHPAVGRPARRLVLPAVGQQPLAAAVGLITPIRKLPAILVKAIRSPRGLHSGVA